MADPQRSRGRARGRAQGGPPQGQQPQRGNLHARPGPSHVPPPIWGPGGQQMAQVRAPAPVQQSVSGGGRAVHWSGPASEPGAEKGDAGGSGREAGGNRGSHRGNRMLTEIVRTRPAGLPTKKGQAGSPIYLTANYFQLEQQTNWCLYQYRVDFAPEEDRTIVKKALFRRAGAEGLKGYLFDGTVLFAPVKLHKNPLELFVQDEKSSNNFRITIRLAGDLAFGDFQYLQVYNIIMRKCLGNLNMQLVRRDYYDAKAKYMIPEHKLELWPGYLTSIRQHEAAVLMCCEIGHKVMRHDTVLQLLQEALQEDRMNYKHRFQDRIVGSVVLTEYNNRTYTIDDVDFNCTPSSTFNKRDGTAISYAQYYQQKYNLRISDMKQPMLVSRAKAREIRAGMAEIVYLVPELCRMTGLTDAQRSNFTLMRALADHTRMRPGPRQQKLMQFINRLTSEPKNIQELKQWDVRFATKLIELQGRVLPTETIRGGSNCTYSAGAQVDWTKDLRAKPMLSCARLEKWVIIYPARCKDGVYSFMPLLLRAANGMSWSLPKPQLQELRDDKPQVYIDALEHVIRDMNPQLIVCVVSNNKSDRYSAIKKKCYVDHAVPCQVIVARNLLSKGAMSIATKVVVQLNCKLGCAPWSVPLPYESCMVVGYDVCHDSNHKDRSYGAMVATMSSDCTQYRSIVTAHTSGEELSNDFSLNVVKFARSYKGGLPSKIIIYRDGVGDGQIPYVLQHELQPTLQKLAELYGGEANVKLVFIIVSKRINARLFYKGDNPPPGTVVDDIITLPERYDFFIVSQCVRQGTVTPTSYNVVYDSMQQPADRIQRVTYKLTHGYYNWSGAVRVPAPCQYAHKLAFLVAQNLHRNPHPDLSPILYYL